MSGHNGGARQIVINAGEDGSIVIGMQKDTYAYDYNAQAGEYGNLISKGIIDRSPPARRARHETFRPFSGW